MTNGPVANFKAKIEELAKDAEEYRQLKEAYADELAGIREENEELFAKRKELEQKLSANIDRLDDVQDELIKVTCTELQTTAALTACERAQDEHDRRQRQLAQMSKFISEELSPVGKLEQRLEDLQNANEQKLATLTEMKARLARKEDALETARERSEQAAARQKLLSQQILSTAFDCGLHERRVHQQEVLASSTSDTVDKLQEQLSDIEAKLAEFDKTEKELTEKLIQLEDELENERAATNEVTKTLTSLTDDLNSA